MGRKSATRVEANPAVIKAMKPLTKGKREAKDDLESKANLKKQKKKHENKETMEGFVLSLQLMEAKMDLLTTKVDFLTSKVDLLATNADLQKILTSLKEFSETKNPDAAAKNNSLTAKAERSSSEDESSSDAEPAKDSSSSSDDDSHQDDKPCLRQKAAPPTSNNASSSDSADKNSDEMAPQSSVQTIYVEGFGSSLPENDIKTALSKHFSACGEITRVFVPTNFETGFFKGFAYIDLKGDATKALELNGSHMIGKELVVKTALLMRDSSPGHSGSGGRFGGRFGNIGGRFGGRFGNVGGRFGGGRCGGYGLDESVS
ncbi:PREDICTED: nucleolin 1-like [Camelina sativa]|uniref:Nucleolin 1-like n=1 Tax=Camelina sativa TaxID=90675 RepID=A0ABM0WDT7_CAMSA|nr:PREDICTED: nucleolin 1-like [Camelina sativa]